MKSHAKRAIKHLEALGFVRDETASNPGKGKYVYRHANDPARPVKVFAGETDSTSTSVMRLGDQIAGIASSGPTMPASIKERARIKKRSEKERRAAELRARNERAARAEAAHQERAAIEATKRHEREVHDLMMPGNGR